MEIKLKLKVKDVEIELSQTEAAELCKALQGLVGEPKIIEKEIIHDHYPWYPTYPWTSPSYVVTSGYATWADTSHISDDVSISYEVTNG